MKKIICILLVIATLCTLCGCGKDSGLHIIYNGFTQFCLLECKANTRKFDIDSVKLELSCYSYGFSIEMDSYYFKEIESEYGTTDYERIFCPVFVRTFVDNRYEARHNEYDYDFSNDENGIIVKEIFDFYANLGEIENFEFEGGIKRRCHAFTETVKIPAFLFTEDKGWISFNIVTFGLNEYGEPIPHPTQSINEDGERIPDPAFFPAKEPMSYIGNIYIYYKKTGKNKVVLSNTQFK